MVSAFAKSLSAGRLTLMIGLLALIAGYQAQPGSLLQMTGGRIYITDLHRILTCHAVHFTPQHLFLDLAAFLGLGLYCELRTGRPYRLLILFSAILVGGGMAMLLPEGAGYRGLSGLVSAQYIFILFLLSEEALRKRNIPAMVILVAAGCGFIGKVFYEYVTATAAFSDLTSVGVMPAPAAHIFGGLAGLIGGSAWCGAKTQPCR